MNATYNLMVTDGHRDVLHGGSVVGEHRHFAKYEIKC